MMLAIARSIAALGRFSPDDVAGRFLEWFLAGAKGIGQTTFAALNELRSGVPWRQAGQNAHRLLREKSAGNGSLMRCAPVALLHYRDQERLVRDTLNSSIITHWDPRAGWGAVALNLAIARLLVGERDGLLEAVAAQVEEQRVADAVRAVAGMTERDIAHSALVLDTLPSALWCFSNTDSLESALVRAVNLGGDTDTNGAVTGALAGAWYGVGAIPARWRAGLTGSAEIAELATRIHNIAEGHRHR
jgi:ADP-ribosyl-[dinitrogen reductase] hydrolase